jgi:hypothetical protein
MGQFYARSVHSWKEFGVSGEKSYNISCSEISDILSFIFCPSTNRQRDFYQGLRTGLKTASFSDAASLNII